MIFSKGTGYALRALIFLAEHMEEGPFHASMMAEAINIQKPILSKTLNKLAAIKLVKSVSGPKGGFWLSKDPSSINLFEIYNAFEPTRSFHECLMGYDTCPGNKYCTLHILWLEPQKRIDDFLNNTSISTLTPFVDGIDPDTMEIRDI